MKYLMIFTLFVQLLTAAPAFHGKRTFTQPDGTEVTYRLQGDEYLNWSESENGAILLYSKSNKRFEFAKIQDNTLIASGIPFSRADATKSASAVTQSYVSKDELRLLHEKRRNEHLSKMKSLQEQH